MRCPTKSKIIHPWMSGIQVGQQRTLSTDVLPDTSSSCGLRGSNDAPAAFLMTVSMETDGNCRCNHHLLWSMETHLTAVYSHAYVYWLVPVACVQHKCDDIHFNVLDVIINPLPSTTSTALLLKFGNGFQRILSQTLLSVSKPIYAGINVYPW